MPKAVLANDKPAPEVGQERGKTRKKEKKEKKKRNHQLLKE
jgi:hypothetical protein